jgi:hypothetical protein
MAKATGGGDATFSLKINSEILEKVRAIAYWDRATIKEISEAAFGDYIAKYEKKNGAVKPIPKR